MQYCQHPNVTNNQYCRAVNYWEQRQFEYSLEMVVTLTAPDWIFQLVHCWHWRQTQAILQGNLLTLIGCPLPALFQWPPSKQIGQKWAKREWKWCGKGYQKRYKGKTVEMSKITKEWGTPLLYLAEYENNEKFKQNIYLFI